MRSYTVLLAAVFALQAPLYGKSIPVQEVQDQFEKGKTQSQAQPVFQDEIKDTAKGLVSADSKIRRRSEEHYYGLPPRMQKKVAGELIIGLTGRAPVDEKYQYAIEALKNTRPSLVVMAACELIAGGHGSRFWAVEVLKKIAPQARESLGVLRRAALEDRNETVRGSALQAIPQILTASKVGERERDFDESVGVFIASLKDGSRFIRERAALVISDLGGGAKRAVPALIETLGDAQPSVRECAALSLGYVDSEGRSLEALTQIAMKDGDVSVRSSAARSLERVKKVSDKN